jgi:predicted kinase
MVGSVLFFERRVRMKKALVLFAGLPLAGKTTISKEVGRRLGFPIVDIDTFKRAVVDPAKVSKEIDPPEIRRQYYELALNHVEQLLCDNRGAIIDEVFHLASLRAWIEDWCAQKDITVVWVEVVCDRAVVEQRMSCGVRHGHILSTEEALQMNALFRGIFEPFENTPDHVCVNNSGNTDLDGVVNILTKLL